MREQWRTGRGQLASCARRRLGRGRVRTEEKGGRADDDAHAEARHRVLAAGGGCGGRKRGYWYRRRRRGRCVRGRACDSNERAVNSSSICVLGARGFPARPRQASVFSYSLALPPQIALPSVPAYLPPPCSHRSSARSLAVWLHVRFTVAHGNRPPGVRCPLPRQTSPLPAPPVPPLSHGSLTPLRPSLPLCLRTPGRRPFLRPLRARSHRSRLHYHRAIRLCGCMQNSNLHRILSLGPCWYGNRYPPLLDRLCQMLYPAVGGREDGLT